VTPLALEPPRPVLKPFVAPAAVAVVRAAPAIPEAPAVAGVPAGVPVLAAVVPLAPMAMEPPRPVLKPFVAPTAVAVVRAAPAIPDAPAVAAVPKAASALPFAPAEIVPAKLGLPADVEREIALYCQKQIGHWKESDAVGLFGRAIRQRPAYDENRTINGTIYAFADPSGRYKDLELDFDRETGRLRTVFVYPPHLTWQQCQRQWAGAFTSADARQGRTFYSYTNRRLDVLVDAGGTVVSLGWY
jgi:hypothetical protein